MDISIILPTDDQNEDIFVRAVTTYAEWLGEFGHSWEILIVPDARTPMPVAQGGGLMQMANVRMCPAANGWGAAVMSGLQASSGRLLCYTNWQRTSTNALSEMLSLAYRNQDVVLRANRRTRDTRVDRMGSLLYNLECRLLLQVPVWDINGTPKIFPRAFVRLLELEQSGNLFDAEFAYVCERADYPVIEVPIEAPLSAGANVSFGILAALRMYIGVIKFWVQISKSLRH